MKYIVISIALGVLGVGAFYGYGAYERSKIDRKFEDVRAIVGTYLKDPASAVFNDVQYYAVTNRYCGYVNAKNSFGGYIGGKAFVADGQAVVFEGDSAFSGATGIKIIEAMCKKK